MIYFSKKNRNSDRKLRERFKMKKFLEICNCLMKIKRNKSNKKTYVTMNKISFHVSKQIKSKNVTKQDKRETKKSNFCKKCLLKMNNRKHYKNKEDLKIKMMMF